MKKLLGILVLGLFLITPSQANDISDFEIDGISIGDSILNFISEDVISTEYVQFYPKNNNYSCTCTYFRFERSRKKHNYH